MNVECAKVKMGCPTCPCMHARCMGVIHHISLASRSAPRSSSVHRTSTCPFAAAQCLLMACVW